VHRKKRCNRFQFQEQVFFDDNVKPIAAIQSHAFVRHRQRPLPLEANAYSAQVMTEAFFVD
jgi:hypothetical protein